MLRIHFKLFVIAVAAGYISAACLPACSSTGFCSADNNCVCDAGYTGLDCSQCLNVWKYVDIANSNTATGYITDGEGDYRVSTQCRERIVGQSNGAETVTLNFADVYTECGYDHLYLYDGDSVHAPLVASFNGYPPDRRVTLTNGVALLRFTSDVAQVKDGYNVTFSFSACPNDCSGNGACTGTTCECTNNMTGADCSIELCPGKCSGYGECGESGCVCDATRTGLDCTQVATQSRWSFVSSPDGPRNAVFNSSQLALRTAHASAVIDLPATSSMWTFGGLAAGFLNSNALAYFDPDLEEWIEVISNNTGPSPRHSHTMVGTPNNTLWVFGGTRDAKETLSDLWEYTVSSNMWTQLADAPFAISRHVAEFRTVKDTMVALMGYTPQLQFTYVILEYTRRNDSWVEHKNITGPLVIGSSAVSAYYTPNDAMIVSGGIRPKAHLQTGSTKKTRILYLETMTWEERDSAKDSVFDAASVLVGPIMYVYGGNAYENSNNDDKESAALCFESQFTAYYIPLDKWHRVKPANTQENPGRVYGHTMHYANGSVLLYGGYDSMLKADTFGFETGVCTDLSNQDDCIDSGCYWCSAGDQCVRPDNAFGVDGCVIPVTAVSTGESRNGACDAALDCRTCYEAAGCKWAGNLCTVIDTDDNTTYTVDDCTVPCESRGNCSECTDPIFHDKQCVWCDSTSQCVPLNEMTNIFAYGGCASYSYDSPEGSCPDLVCANQLDYKHCYSTPGCGWCDFVAKTGEGLCVDGNGMGPLPSANVTCPADSTYHFAPPEPTCQCSGHSTCDGGGRCGSCEGNTEGLNCESCIPGYFGNALNNGTCAPCETEFNGVACLMCDNLTGGCTDCVGNVTGAACNECGSGFYGDPLNGTCEVCLCNNQTDTCDSTTGRCVDCPPGVDGGSCDVCDENYMGDPTLPGGHCYFNLQVNTRYEVTLPEGQTRYFYVFPVRDNSELNITFANSGVLSPRYNSSLTIFWRTDKTMELIVADYTEPFYTNVFSQDVYDFNAGWFEVEVSEVGDIPEDTLRFQLFYTQYRPPPNLVKFFVTFFACFFILLAIGLSIWKARLVQLRRRAVRARQVELETMAARPFATAKLNSITDNYSLTCRSTPAGAATKMPHPLSTEPFADGETVIQTVLIQLPTPVDAPVYKIAFGSTLQTSKKRN